MRPSNRASDERPPARTSSTSTPASRAIWYESPKRVEISAGSPSCRRAIRLKDDPYGRGYYYSSSCLLVCMIRTGLRKSCVVIRRAPIRVSQSLEDKNAVAGLDLLEPISCGGTGRTGIPVDLLHPAVFAEAPWRALDRVHASDPSVDRIPAEYVLPADRVETLPIRRLLRRPA